MSVVFHDARLCLDDARVYIRVKCENLVRHCMFGREENRPSTPRIETPRDNESDETTLPATTNTRLV